MREEERASLQGGAQEESREARGKREGARDPTGGARENQKTPRGLQSCCQFMIFMMLLKTPPDFLFYILIDYLVSQGSVELVRHKKRVN